MRIKAKTKNLHLIVTAKMQFGEEIDERALDAFSRIYLRGFLKPKLLNKRTLECTGPIGVSLAERFQKPVGQRDFLFIIEQLVLAIQKIQLNNLKLDMAVFDLRYVFINEVTKELQILYIPKSRGITNVSLMQFVEDIIYSISPADEKAAETISRFTYFIKNQTEFVPETVEKYVLHEDRSVVNTIKRQNAGQSGFMTSKHQHYVEHYEEKEREQEHDGSSGELQHTEKRDPHKETVVSPKTVVRPERKVVPKTDVEEEATDVLEEDTSVLDEEEEATTFLDEEEEATTFLDEEEETSILEEEATSLLVEDEEGTMLLTDANKVRFPTLFRVLTEEKISINKPVFRLGKEKSYVDYFISNNNAVSRSHADIITRGKKYFILDLNSKNHTYINDQIVPVQCETELHDGDHIKLGNEEFIFNA